MASTDCNGSDIGMDVLDEKVLDMAHIQTQDRTEIRTQDRNEIRTQNHIEIRIQNHIEIRIQYHMVSDVVQIDKMVRDKIDHLCRNKVLFQFPGK